MDSDKRSDMIPLGDVQSAFDKAIGLIRSEFTESSWANGMPVVVTFTHGPGDKVMYCDEEATITKCIFSASGGVGYEICDHVGRYCDVDAESVVSYSPPETGD